VSAKQKHSQEGDATRLLIPTLLLLPAAALAGTGFDGTWKTNMESLKTTGRPIVLRLAGGKYTCSSCNPPYTVEADGAEHKVGGEAHFSTVNVKVTGPNSAEIVLKQRSKEVARFGDTVSDFICAGTARVMMQSSTARNIRASAPK
jgi:hypothetical protein